MVNRGSFHGSRKEFLLGEKAAYAAGVAGGYAADALAVIQRRYFKRYPIDLPHDEEPTQEHLLAVDDNSPEPEQSEPDADALSAEDFAAAMVRVKTRRDLVISRKAQIKRWLAYQYMKDQDLDPTDSGAGNPYRVLIHKLIGVPIKRPRMKTPVNVWRKTQRVLIDEEVARRMDAFSSSNSRRKDLVGMRDKVAREMFGQLSAVDQAEWVEQAKEEHEAALAAWKSAWESKPSTSPAERQKCIQGLTRFVQPILDSLADATGWKVSLIAGGPEPADGGRLNILSVHSGTTPGDIKMNFGRAERAHYKKYVVPAFGFFLQKCYTIEECRSRALPEAQGFPRLSGLDLDDEGVTFDSIERAPSQSSDERPSPPPLSSSPSIQPTLSAPPPPSGVAPPSPRLPVLPSSRMLIPPPPPMPAPPSPRRSVPPSPRRSVPPSPRRSVPPSPRRSVPPPPRLSVSLSGEQPVPLSPRSAGPSPPRTLSPSSSSRTCTPPLQLPSLQPNVALGALPQLPDLTTAPSASPRDGNTTGVRILRGSEHDGQPGDWQRRLAPKRMRSESSNASNDYPPVSKRLRSSTFKPTPPTRQPSPRAEKTKRSTVEPLPACPSDNSSSSTPSAPPLANIPLWFQRAMAMFNEERLGAEWMELVRVWALFEQKERYVDRGYLKASSRPVAVKDWIQRARPPHWRPNIDNLVAYEEDFRDWWTSLQPQWRISDGAVMLEKVDGDWSVLRKSGINGILSVLAGIFFWGCHLIDVAEDQDMWALAVQDCTQALIHLGRDVSS